MDVTTHIVPPEHYNWFWDNLPPINDEAKTTLRNRFRRLYTRLRHGQITSRHYRNLYSELKDDLLEEVEEFNLIEFQDVADEEIVQPEPEVSESGDFVLEIPEEVETAAAVSEAVETGPGIAGAVGGFIAGGAIALGTKEAISEDGHKKPIISVGPDHNYIGPGNTVGTDNDPEPVDDSDRIAYNHDLDYLKAQTEQDVRDADNAAVAQFSEKALEGDWRSAAGAIGIQAKQLAEKVTGQLYPGKQLCLVKVELNLILMKGQMPILCLLVMIEVKNYIHGLIGML
nr:VP2 [Mute swan feces associated ambidensovirus 7]